MKLKTKKKNTIFFVLFVCVVFLFLIPLLLFLVPKNKKTTHVMTIHPVDTTTQQVPSLSPSPSISTVSESPQQRLIAKINSKQPLSASDIKVKNTILSSIPSSGIVYQTTNVTIAYVKTFDFFQAEITTTNSTDAKNGAVKWFMNQGMSQEGICNLPLSFYLDSTIKNQLPDAGKSFNPLSDGC